jgi:hypothetical protein
VEVSFHSERYNSHAFDNAKPNVAIEWLALLPRIWKVPGSNLVPETGYPEVFCGFPQLFYGNSGAVAYIRLAYEHFFHGQLIFYLIIQLYSRSMWPSGLRRRSWPLCCCDCGYESRSGHGCLCLYVVLSCVGRGLCDELITRPMESCHVSYKIKKPKTGGMGRKRDMMIQLYI